MNTAAKHSRGKMWVVALISVLAVALIVFLVFFGLYHPRKLVAYVKKKPEELLKAEVVTSGDEEHRGNFTYTIKKEDLASFAREFLAQNVKPNWFNKAYRVTSGYNVYLTYTDDYKVSTDGYRIKVQDKVIQYTTSGEVTMTDTLRTYLPDIILL